MLVYLAIVGLLLGVNTSPIESEVDRTYRQDRQVKQACIDFVDPRTGSSDCPGNAARCRDPVYQQLMREQCPLTCGICQPCIDFVHPRTGVSDCPRSAALCTDLLYWKVMWEQCPWTCGRCPFGVLPNPGECFDRVDPLSGVSDCPSRAALCTNPVYREMMSEQCPLTCNVCPGRLPN